MKNLINNVVARERQHITNAYWIPFYTEAGPLNIIKGLVTGWRHMTAHPDTVYRYCNLYTPETARAIKREGYNVVFVGWSVGFSLGAEKIQRDQVIAFAAECHRLGIQVMPYLCSITMFQEDFFQAVPAAKEWMQLNCEGKPIYYHDVPRRAIACLRQPQWREYAKQRIRLAIAAGLDCIYLDNPINRCYCPLCRKKFRTYLRQKRKTFFNPPDENQIRKLLSRPGKFIHVELACMDELLRRGRHAKIARQWLLWSDFASQGALDYLADMSCFVHQLSPKTPISCNGSDLPRFFRDMDFVLAETAWFPNFEKGRFRSNMDLMHYHAGDARYVKPVVSLQGQDRSWRADDPRIQRLSLAEGAAFSISMCAHQYREFHAPEFTRFFNEHQRLYIKQKSMAPLAVLMPHVRVSHLPDLLAEANILYDRILPEYLLETDLSRYRAIIIDDLPQISSNFLAALMRYLRQGGHIAVSRSSGIFDENFDRRSVNPFTDLAKRGMLYYSRKTLLRPDRYFMHYTDWTGGNPPPQKKIPPRLISLLTDWDALLRVKINPSKAIMAHMLCSRQTNRFVIHFLNYAPQRARNVNIILPHFPGKVKHALLHVPGKKSLKLPVDRRGNGIHFILKVVDIYAVVEIGVKS